MRVTVREREAASGNKDSEGVTELGHQPQQWLRRSAHLQTHSRQGSGDRHETGWSSLRQTGGSRVLLEQQGFAPGFLGHELQRSCRLDPLKTEDRAEGAAQLVEGLLLT